MKKLVLSSFMAGCAALMLMVAGVVTVSCDKFDDSQLQAQISDLDGRLTALETEIETQIAALNALIEGKITIAACAYDEEKGIFTVTLSDAQTVIEIPSLGNTSIPVLSYIEEDGKKYWAVVNEGGETTALTDSKGDKVEIGGAVVPALSLGEGGEWMYSLDGNTWTGLGVTGEEVTIFTGIEELEDSYILTLAGGRQLVVAKTDFSDVAFYPRAGLQHFDAGESKSIKLVADGLKNTAVTEKPEGWKAKSDGSVLNVTAPSADNADADQSGTVKILGVTEDGKSFISEVYVALGEPAVTITLHSAAQKAEIVSGEVVFYYDMVPLSEFSIESIVSDIENYEFHNTAGAWNGNVDATFESILGAPLTADTPYVVWAVAADDYGTYSAADVYYEIYQPVVISIEAAEAMYDNINISVKVDGVESYVPGCFVATNTSTLEDILFEVKMWGPSYTRTSNYDGVMTSFGYNYCELINPDTEYTVFVLPVTSEKGYSDLTIDDFVTMNFKTGALQDGGSADVALELKEADFSSVSATATVQGDYYKLYGVYMPDDMYQQYASDEAGLVTYLISPYNVLSSDEISASWLAVGSKGWFASIAVDKDGKYGKLSVIEANTLSYQPGGSLEPSITVGEITYTGISATVSYNAGEGVQLYSAYMTAEEYSQNSSEDALAQYLFANGLQMTEVSRTGLNSGAEGYVVAVVVDQDGKYGKVAVEKVVTKILTFSTETVSLGEYEVSMSSFTVPYTVSSGVVKLRCLNVDSFTLQYNYAYGQGDINTIETYLATYVAPDPNLEPWAVDYNITDISDLSSGEVEIPNLIRGQEYNFYMIGFDENDNPTHICEAVKYVPEFTSTIIRSTLADGSANPDYSLGSPTYTLSAESSSGAFYTVTCMLTNMPSDCKECYVGLVDAEKVNDYYESTLQVMTGGMTLVAGGETQAQIEWLTQDSYIGVAWLDSNGGYHQAYMTPVSEIVEQSGLPDAPDMEITPGDNAK